MNLQVEITGFRGLASCCALRHSKLRQFKALGFWGSEFQEMSLLGFVNSAHRALAT